jgi:hypothetical protein
MTKIFFDDTTFIWKTKLNLVEDKSKLLKESYELIKSMPENNTDGYIASIVSSLSKNYPKFNKNSIVFDYLSN